MTGRTAALLLLAAPLLAAPRLSASLSRSRIHVGESVVYTVTLHDAETRTAPDVSAHARDFDVLEGTSSTQTQYINGQVSSRQEFRYRLTPKRAGTLPVPPATLRHEGGELRTRVLTLDVVEPEEQDLVVLDVATEPAASSVYPWQELTVRLRVFVKRLPGRYRDLDPVEQIEPPRLRVPWVEPAEGLESASLSEWLNPLLARDKRGFLVNDLKLDQPLGFFSDQVRAVFDLDGRPAAELPDRLKGRGDYYVYTLARTFRPLRQGRTEFGQVTLKGNFVEKVEDGRAVFRAVYAAARPLVVDVRPVPARGKPASFTGGIGVFSIAAEAAPAEVRVGDPVTLTLTVTGEGNLDDVNPPPLAGFDAFKVYEATATTENGRRVFTHSIRPSRADVTAVPPVELSYFDVTAEKYVTVATEPVPLVVEEATRLDSAEIEGAREPSELEAAREGLFANIGDAREVRDESVRPVAYATYLLALAAAYVALSLLIGRWQRLSGDPALLRRRGAKQRARARLAADGLHVTLAGLVADLRDEPEAGLTAREIGERLRGLGSTHADEAERALVAIEEARYGGAEADDPPDLLERILEDLK